MAEEDVDIVDLIAGVRSAVVRVCMNWNLGRLDGPIHQLWVIWIYIPETDFCLRLPGYQAGSTDLLFLSHWQRSCSSCLFALVNSFCLDLQVDDGQFTIQE
jgi:hypothetical protein